ncbi:MAG: hormogonium polysaccharide secretion pseudopilin HpsC [Cyanobacteriota bacterium]|nr:hormogonium polysaccharide secretion pseudopilin HpsC [Cyanobacteriota bacterium]
MKTLLNLLLKTQPHQRRHPSKSTGGFTMIELLVGMVIAFLIITPMLAFVVNILNSDVKEQAKTNTEQDLQAAMDYIAQDMSQALYVYTPAEINLILNPEDESGSPLEPAIRSDGNLGNPKIVFWKRKYEEKAVPINDTVTCPSDQCDDTFVMSLVAYYQIDENDPSSVWCEKTPCPSRIARVEISDNPKKLDGSYVTADPTNGYNPDNQAKIASPVRLTKGAGALTNAQAVVLVNHIEEITLDDDVLNNKLAKITIIGNAKRRVPGNFSDLTCSATDTSPYCPKATARVGARSGYGENE